MASLLGSTLSPSGTHGHRHGGVTRVPLALRVGEADLKSPTGIQYLSCGVDAIPVVQCCKTVLVNASKGGIRRAIYFDNGRGTTSANEGQGACVLWDNSNVATIEIVEKGLENGRFTVPEDHLGSGQRFDGGRQLGGGRGGVGGLEEGGQGGTGRGKEVLVSSEELVSDLA